MRELYAKIDELCLVVNKISAVVLGMVALASIIPWLGCYDYDRAAAFGAVACFMWLVTQSKEFSDER